MWGPEPERQVPAPRSPIVRDCSDLEQLTRTPSGPIPVCPFRPLFVLVRAGWIHPFVRCTPRRWHPFSRGRRKSAARLFAVVACRRARRILFMVSCGTPFRRVPPPECSPASPFVCQPAIPTLGLPGRRSACPPGRWCATLLRPYLPRKRGIPPMRVRRLLVLFTFAVLGLTAGCRHHRHCCRGGYGPACCAPCCDTCCGYATEQSPMPPLAVPVPTPPMPISGSH
jgi:hypothetical protein